MNEIPSIQSSIEINGWPIYYEKFGTGPKPLLLIPNAIGTGRTDYMLQLEGEDAFDFGKYTMIAVEAPGWGRSRPPIRKYGNNVYNNDAECFNGLMQQLGYEKYSIIGWSDGARVALLMTIKFPETVLSVILTSISPLVSEKCLKYMLAKKDIEKWGKDKLECYLRSYESEDEIQKLWTRYLKFVEYYSQYFPEDMYKNKYRLIRCPVLLIHGDMNQMVDVSQPYKMSKLIQNAQLHRSATGDHDFHQKYPAAFKKLVDDFLAGVTNVVPELIDEEWDQCCLAYMN